MLSIQCVLAAGCAVLTALAIIAVQAPKQLPLPPGYSSHDETLQTSAPPGLPRVAGNETLPTPLVIKHLYQAAPLTRRLQSHIIAAGGNTWTLPTTKGKVPGYRRSQHHTVISAVLPVATANQLDAFAKYNHQQQRRWLEQDHSHIAVATPGKLVHTVYIIAKPTVCVYGFTATANHVFITAATTAVLASYVGTLLLISIISTLARRQFHDCPYAA